MKYCLSTGSLRLFQENPFYATLNLALSRNETSIPSERSFRIIITEKDFADCNALLKVGMYWRVFSTPQSFPLLVYKVHSPSTFFPFNCSTLAYVFPCTITP